MESVHGRATVLLLGVYMDAVEKLPVSVTKAVKALYVIVNAVIALFQVSASYSVWGLLRSVAIVAVCAAIVMRSEDDKPACAYLCLFFFMQCLVYVGGVHWDEISSVYNGDGFKTFFEYIKNIAYPDGFYLLGIVLSFFGLIYKKHTWLTGVGGGLLGLVFLLPLYMGVGMKELWLNTVFSPVIVSYILAVVCWTVALQIVVTVCPAMRTECVTMGAMLLCAVIVMVVCCGQYVADINPDMESAILTLLKEQMSWWRTIIAAVLLLVAYAATSEDFSAPDSDSFVLLMSATTVLAIRILMSNYFVYNWALLLLFVALALVALQKNEDHEVFFGLNGWQFLWVEFIVFIPVALLLCWGLWANVLITVAFGVLFYRKRQEMLAEPSGNLLWISVISLLVFEAFARMAMWRFSTEGYIMLGLVYAMAVAVILIINRKHPSDAVPNNGYHIIVAVCVGILCLASLRSPIKIDAVTEGDSVRITTEVSGEDNKIGTNYEWTDYFGRKVTEKAALKDGEGEKGSSIPIQSDVLTVTSVDSHGVACKRRFFYAPWMHNCTPAKDVFGS